MKPYQEDSISDDSDIDSFIHNKELKREIRTKLSATECQSIESSKERTTSQRKK